MDKRKIGYWIATALVCFGFAFGGVFDALRTAEGTAMLAHLGYPSHFGLTLGVWKTAGAIVVGAPKLPRAKEWAYAGMVINLTGAAFAHVVTGDSMKDVLTPLVFLAIVVASWALRPDERKLAGPLI